MLMSNLKLKYLMIRYLNMLILIQNLALAIFTHLMISIFISLFKYFSLFIKYLILVIIIILLMRILQKLFSKHSKPPIHNLKNPLFKLFLHGLKGIFQIKPKKSYNYYLYFFNILSAVFLSQYIIKSSKNEFQQRKEPNILIPSYIYKVRTQHYIYWQLARLAKNKSTTFTYYKWDSQNNIMYVIDRLGKQKPLQTHNTIQSPQIMSSPIFQKYYPAPPQLHSQIYMYIKNINNPYDLNNHLHHKSINIGDWIRAIYYCIYRQLGITNRWRYDQYVSKPDIYYQWQKVKLGFRLSRDRELLYKYIDSLKINIQTALKYFIWFI